MNQLNERQADEHTIEHTIEMVGLALDQRGLSHHPLTGGEQLMCQCPKHNGGDENCRISISGNGHAFCYCYSHCGKFWLDEVFDEFETSQNEYQSHQSHQPPTQNRDTKRLIARTTRPTHKNDKLTSSKFETQYNGSQWAINANTPVNSPVGSPVNNPANTGGASPQRAADLKNLWLQLQPLPERQIFQGIGNKTLEEDYGWRWIPQWFEPALRFGFGEGVFIPYWSDRVGGSLNFAQARYLSGKKRFSFAKGMNPTIFGKWIINLLLEDAPENRSPLVITEGSHDAIVLNECFIPAIALPSASATVLGKTALEWLDKKKISVFFAGDNDDAGEKLFQSLRSSGVPLRDMRPPKVFKDWAEAYEKLGSEIVLTAFSGVQPLANPEIADSIPHLLQVFPNAKYEQMSRVSRGV